MTLEACIISLLEAFQFAQNCQLFLFVTPDEAVSKDIYHVIYLGSNIPSTESDVNKYIGKEWTAIDSLSIIWKLDLC